MYNTCYLFAAMYMLFWRAYVSWQFLCATYLPHACEFLGRLWFHVVVSTFAIAVGGILVRGKIVSVVSFG